MVNAVPFTDQQINTILCVATFLTVAPMVVLAAGVLGFMARLREQAKAAPPARAGVTRAEYNVPARVGTDPAREAPIPCALSH